MKDHHRTIKLEARLSIITVPRAFGLRMYNSCIWHHLRFSGLLLLIPLSHGADSNSGGLLVCCVILPIFVSLLHCPVGLHFGSGIFPVEPAAFRSISFCNIKIIFQRSCHFSHGPASGSMSGSVRGVRRRVRIGRWLRQWNWKWKWKLVVHLGSAQQMHARLRLNLQHYSGLDHMLSYLQLRLRIVFCVS